MDERVVQLRIGLMVLATLIIVVILLTLFGGQRTLLDRFQRKHVYYIQFPEAPEVNPNTPVQKSGVRIGRVTEVRLADEVTDMELDDDAGVVVTVEIDWDRMIFADEVCRIKRNLLGDAILEFVKAKGSRRSEDQSRPSVAENSTSGVDGNGNGDGSGNGGAEGNPPREAVKSGTLLRGQVQSDPLQVVGNMEADLANVIQSVTQTSDEIRNFVGRINQFLGTEEQLGPRQERLNNILDASLRTMETIQELAGNVNDVVGDEELRQKLKDTVAEFPAVIEDARRTLGQMSHTFEGMDVTIRQVTDSLGKIDPFIQRLGEDGPEMIGGLNRAVGNLDLLLGDMRAFSKNLQSGEGTVGRLIRDPELYDNLNRAVANMEDLTRRLQPVVENARGFSDKIARHPELLGVRGALEQSPGTKGVPRLSQLRETSDLPQTPEYPYFSQPR